MKISHIILSLGTGGAEKLLVDHLPLYKKKGHEVEIVQISSVLEARDYILEVEKSQIPLITLSSGSFYNPVLLFKMYKFLKNTDADIIHAHLFQSSYFVSMASYFVKNERFKLVFTEHNSENGRNTKPFLKPLEQFIYRKFAAIIGITEYITEMMHKWLGPISHFCTIENGVDISKFENAQSYTLQELNSILKRDNHGSYYDLMMVARFSPQKNHYALVKSLLFLDEQFHLILVGDGAVEENLKVFISENALDKRVHFLGFRNDVPKLMKSVKINILSTNYEGLPGVALEAMASGKPFIGSNVKGVNDVLTDRQFLFENNDHEGLAVLIQKIRQIERFKTQLLVNQKEVVRRYDADIMVKKHIGLYENLLNS